MIFLRFAKAWQQQYGDPVHPGTKRGYTTGHRPAVLLHLCVPEQPESLTSTSATPAQTRPWSERRNVHAHGLQTKGEMLLLTDQWISAQKSATYSLATHNPGVKCLKINV